MATRELPLIETSAAWTAKSLQDSSDWLQSLTVDELTDLKRAVTAVSDKATSGIEAVEIASLGKLDDRLRQIQHALEHGVGATWLRGLDLSDYSDDEAELLFWLVVQNIGTPVSQSATGERVFRVRDAGLTDSDSRARGPNTRKRLSFHTDRCDVIAFLCVHPALEGGENDVISSVMLYNRMRELRPDLCRTLMQPYYYQRHNVDRGNELPYCQQPVFSIFEGHFAANCLRVLIERAHASPEVPDLTDEQRAALDFLEELAEDETLYYRFRLQRGDMLFLNNWVTFHRRTQFVDAADPAQNRLLYRAWLAMPNSRPLDPLFAANYGNTAAGSIRGGMRPAS